ncbi:MAG: hypothetical protein KDD73_06090 [Anaerolineales bacterium]|nr:hypothetical protein [Anaerolineales bacterium]MCB9129282.1 hypothetical protein [Ardenticatenales bacterium]
MATTSNSALRLQRSLMEELRTVAEEENTTINQFINVAIAEKLAVLRTQRYFEARAARGDREAFLALLEKAGSEAPREGDELPSGPPQRAAPTA